MGLHKRASYEIGARGVPRGREAEGQGGSRSVKAVVGGLSTSWFDQ